MKIGFIAPMKEELAPLIRCLDNMTTRDFKLQRVYEGALDGKPAAAICSGVSKVNAAMSAQLLIDLFGVSHVVVIGVAGGMSPQLTLGDTLVVESSTYHDVDWMFFSDYFPHIREKNFPSDRGLLECSKRAAQGRDLRQKIHFGSLVTGDSFIEQEGREEIIRNHNPLCVDMETAAIAHVCHINGIPYIAYRSVSD
ncbi:MAG TPA: 5'-methylthioadenosine/S-adenosylhomocysteine nucleosidase, partial [Clostridia bacterium]|nr:5'-methylthioadenosine/S-adenosylhomocysteine nucleosidase [Clostridia bacterium]